MLVDSHCHLDRLDLSDRDAGLDGILADARARGITQFLSVAVDLATSASLVELTERYDHVYSSVGVHPLQKIDQPVPEVEQLVALARAPKVVAIGISVVGRVFRTSRRDRQSCYVRSQVSEDDR